MMKIGFCKKCEEEFERDAYHKKVCQDCRTLKIKPKYLRNISRRKKLRPNRK